MGEQFALYEKCAGCHLFIERNEVNGNVAEFVHLDRGDESDERITETHDASQSGERFTLDYWKENGPVEMRARFTA